MTRHDEVFKQSKGCPVSKWETEQGYLVTVLMVSCGQGDSYRLGPLVFRHVKYDLTKGLNSRKWSHIHVQVCLEDIPPSRNC